MSSVAGRSETLFPLILALGGLFLLALSLYFGWMNPFFNDAVHRFGQGVDFFGVYQSAYDGWRGQSVYLYHDAVPGFVQAVPYFYGFVYWPVLAYLAGLFLLLPPWPAYWAWVGCLFLLVLVNLHLTWQEARTMGERVLGVLLWLAYTPLYLECYMGQFTLALATLSLAMLRAYERGQGKWGDGWWIAGFLWKQLGVYLTPLLLRLKRWLALGVVSFVGLVCTVPYFLLFPQDWIYYWEAQRHEIVIHAGNLGFQAWLVDLGRRFAPLTRPAIGSLSWLDVLVSLWTGSIALLALLSILRPRRPALLESITLWITVYFLTYKHVWEHHYVWLLPFLVLLILRKRRPAYLLLYLLLALPTPFRLLDLPTGPEDPQPLWKPWISAFYHASKAWPALALFLFLVVELWRIEGRPQWPGRLRREKSERSENPFHRGGTERAFAGRARPGRLPVFRPGPHGSRIPLG